MCKKVNNKNCSNTRIDKCMKGFIQLIKSYGIETLGCCCGHGKYPLTIVFRRSNGCLNGNIYDLISGRGIPRTRNFYKRDKKGYYYIPEVSKEK